MKPRCVWPVFLLCFAVVPLPAEEQRSDWGDRPRLLVTGIAAPLSPSLSLLELSLPFRSLGLRGAAADLEGSLWYLADSPYLFPRSYFELGAGLDWTWLRRGRVALSAGLGTSIGYEVPTRSVSVPLIAQFRFRLIPRDWLCLETAIRGFLYGQGGGAEARVLGLFRPFRGGFLLGAGVGYGFLAEWDFNPFGQALQVSLSAGCTW